MNQYPTMHLQITESATNNKSTQWPAAMAFPQRCQDVIFSLPQSPVAVTQPVRWIIQVDLRKLAQWLAPTIH
ncbi:hypothetical protein [Vibrio sp.]|uniref:hypothetical protein n=1 Tax=Vibrio sp. TaxID=678 RepID=UPI003D0BFFD1